MVASLAEDCQEGFKLAWITGHRDMFERLVRTEDPTTRTGVQARVFSDEHNALTWLRW